MMNGRVHVMMDARKAGDYGIGTYIRSLGNVLAEERPAWTFTSLVQKDQAGPRLGDPWRELPVPYRKYGPGEYFLLGRDIRRTAPSVFHSPHFTVPRDTGVPTVVTVQDVIPLLFPAIFNRAKRAYARFMISHAVRTSARVIVSSDATRRELVGRFRVSDARITVIPLGVSEAFFSSSDEQGGAGRPDAHGILPKPYILFVGNPKPHKGIDVLLKALARIRKNGIDVNLVLAGGDAASVRDVLSGVASAKSLESHIHILGHPSEADLVAAYAGAELLAVPSLYEGFGLPVLEGMAAGTAVVCSDGGGLPEVAGDAATVVPRGNVEALAAAMTTLLEDTALRASFVRKGLDRARLFTWRRTAQETLVCYEQVLGSAGSGIA